MKLGFYPKLALTAVSKNRKIYVPYMLTCVGMVMMFYIISFLSVNRNVAHMPGGISIQMMLQFGCEVIGIFSLIFLFYTNSFLIKKRKKEFGLYNILGMGKRNLARILIWENLFIAVVALVGGLFCGILFSKAAELLMAHMLGGKITFEFSIESASVLQTLAVFAAIFLLIFLNGLRQIRAAKPVELLQSDKSGEKPPKSNRILAILGVIILAAAYYIALSVKKPIAAFEWFFLAVIMVIIATYLLFIVGSVVFCRILQRNKRYYYKTDHFVSVSSMVYRMKRNGAGLASICILSTMVLVMLSTTVCLFIGTENSLNRRYPQDIAVDTYSLDRNCAKLMENTVASVLKKYDAHQKNILKYNFLSPLGYLKGNSMVIDPAKLRKYQDHSDTWQLFIIPLSDYNRLTGANETLSDNEVIISCTKSDYIYNTISIPESQTLQIKKKVSKFVDNGSDSMLIYPSMFIAVRNFNVPFVKQIMGTIGNNSIHAYYGFNLTCSDSTQIAVKNDILSAVRQLQSGNKFPAVSVESRASERNEFYAFYGGIFFLGVILGIVFLLGTILIMYYKQITEGYEDQSRFDIMQKVGMTKAEIKKSVNSQVLTVFFLPLITAGIHVIFAFPMISKLLALFALRDVYMLAVVTVCCYFAFAIFYIVIYVLTSRAYYGIVSSMDEMK